MKDIVEMLGSYKEYDPLTDPAVIEMERWLDIIFQPPETKGYVMILLAKLLCDTKENPE